MRRPALRSSALSDLLGCLLCISLLQVVLVADAKEGLTKVDARTNSRVNNINRTDYFGVTDPALLQWLHVPVQEIWRASASLPGFEDVSKDSDQEEINQWNDADMAYWQQRAPLSMDVLWNMPLHRLNNRADVRRLVAIRNNKVYFLRQDLKPYTGRLVMYEAIEPVNPELHHWTKTMKQFLEKNVFPDVVFFFSVYDWPTCGNHKSGHADECPVPVLSYQKCEGWKDILIPRLTEMSFALNVFDWKLKVEKAFVRATPYCQGSGPQPFIKCARSYFSQAFLYHNMTHILEAALTTGYGFRNETDKQVLANGPLPGKGYFPLVDHARYKYLLDTDGMTGSYRAAKLMHFNSPVFKQASPWFEWYTRSLVPGVHHIKFWLTSKEDIYDIIEQHRHNESALQELTRNAMRFAYKYTAPQARMFYMKRALFKYKTLFGPHMDTWMAAFDWGAADRPTERPAAALMGQGHSAREGHSQEGSERGASRTV